MWSVRWKKVNNEYILANAKPCLYCRNVIRKCGVRTVFYSDDNGEIKKTSINDLECKLTTASIIHLKSKCGYKNASYR